MSSIFTVERVGVFLTLVASLLGIFTMEKQAWFFFIPLWYNDTQTFYPEAIHAGLALAMIIPLYVRRLLKFEKYNLEMVLHFIINVLLLAVWMKIIIVTSVTAGLTLYVLIAIIALSWLGIRSIAGWVWIALFVLLLKNILDANAFFQWRGFPFVVFSFLGLAMQTRLMPGNFVTEMIATYKPERIAENARESIKASGKSLNK